eukprot:TRINITY_DN6826_c0_g1_i1.p1 TRINITY_DN6826_c0_g1~~TRINITY_DN6826_c0_g1_i1.p1  ORF type:complete len:802 (+),score=356.86 TRINITY_DN6826_c0_g1_i1:35-2440(+)
MPKKTKSQRKYETSKLPKELQRRKDFKTKTQNWKKKNDDEIINELDKKIGEQEKIAESKNQYKKESELKGKDFDKFVEDGYNKIMNEEDSNEEDDDEEEEEFSDIDDNEEEEENVDLGDQIQGYKSELKDLEKTDPKFYEYLLRKDKNLLSFDTDDQYSKTDKNKITPQKLNIWISEAKKGSVRALRNIIVSFYLSTDSTGIDEKEKEKKEKLQEKRKFMVADELTYNLLISYVFEDAPSILLSYLENREKGKKPKKSSKKENNEEEMSDEEEEAGGEEEGGVGGGRKKVKILTSYKRWKEVSMISKIMVKGMLEMISSVKEEVGLKFILQNVEEKICPFFSAFRKERSKLLKKMLVIWSSHESVESRLLSFLVIRKMSLTTPYPFLSLALKGVYLTFIQNSSSLNSSTAPFISAMINCIVELYKIDINLSYQHSFVYIRQLSIHLRNTLLHNPNKSSLQRSLYNWKFIHSIRVWVQLLSSLSLSTSPSSLSLSPSTPPTPSSTNKKNKKKGGNNTNEEEEDFVKNNSLKTKGNNKTSAVNTNNNMQLLIYPLVQIICGTIEMKSGGTSYIPLHLTLIQYLNNLSLNCGVFIPVSTYLLNILDKSVFTTASIDYFKKKAKSEKGKKPIPILSNENLFLTLKLNENYYFSRINLQLIFDNVVHILLSNLSYWSKTVSFPELSFPVLISLKKFSKSYKFISFIKVIKNLLKGIEDTNQFIESKRNSLQLSPKSLSNPFIIPVSTNTPIIKLLQSFSLRKAQAKPPQGASKDLPIEEESEEKPSNKRKESQKENSSKTKKTKNG